MLSAYNSQIFREASLSNFHFFKCLEKDLQTTKLILQAYTSLF